MSAQFSLQYKQFLLEKLWLVVLAGKRVEDTERNFITWMPAINLDAEAIKAAR